MSIEDFDPMKHGPVAVFFAAAVGFLMWLLGKAKTLFKNGDAAEIKAMLTMLDTKVDGIDVRLARIEGRNDALDAGQPGRPRVVRNQEVFGK